MGKKRKSSDQKTVSITMLPGSRERIEKALVFPTTGKRNPSEGTLKVFYEIYNDGLIIEHVGNKSLRNKLQRLRANIGVDFYNLLTEDADDAQFEDFVTKYIGYESDRSLNTSFDLTAGETTIIGIVREERAYFRTIADKILAGEKPSEKELDHINKRFCGYVRVEDNDGAWSLRRSFYFANFGLYRVLYDWIMRVSQDRIDVKRCALGGCERLFLASSPGSQRKYCQTSHKVRAYQIRQKKTAVV